MGNHTEGWRSAYWSGSDSTLKKDIYTISSALNKVERLRGVSYNWNEKGVDRQTKDIPQIWSSGSKKEGDNEALWAKKKDEKIQELSRTNIGFIAQELQEVFPDWVKMGEDGYLTIDTHELPFVLVEAVKELKSQKDNEIAQLKQELSTVKTELASMQSLQKRLEILEAALRDKQEPTDTKMVMAR